MASFFRGLDNFRNWNNRIHPELEYVRDNQAQIAGFPADGPAGNPPNLAMANRPNRQLREDVAGYMAQVINELLDLLKDTPANFCSDAVYNSLRTGYFNLLRDIATAEEGDMARA